MQRTVRVLIVGAIFSIAGAAMAAERPPNIVFILADDLGYGDLSCYGQEKFETPNIDRLAAEGMKFTAHYSGSTVCAPSRSALMTGQHTGHTPVRGNRTHEPEGQVPIADEVVTVAELLKDRGYATGAFGKWGLGYPGSEGDPIHQGFDTFYGYNCQRHAHRYYVDYLWHDLERVDISPDAYTHDLIGAKALEFIRANANEPFFCFMPLTIPHAAMQVPDDSAAPYREKFDRFSDKVGKYAGTEVKNPIANFAGMVTRMDRTVGEVLASLSELGIDKNTLVMFSSDNGPHLEGGHDPKFFNSNGPFRGFKRDLTDGGIRVPMLARWPGTIEAGATSDHLSAFWDLLPTFVGLAGGSAPDNIDGISMTPTLLGKPEEQTAHDYLYWEFHERGGKQAIRKGKWKAIKRNVSRANKPSPIQLYNLDVDVTEENDVSGEHPAVVEEMRALFEKARTPSERFPLFPHERAAAG